MTHVMSSSEQAVYSTCYVMLVSCCCVLLTNI